MLAATAKAPARDLIDALITAGSWWFEIKYDGIRAVIAVDAEGNVVITNRRGRDITFRYPEVVAFWSGFGFVGTLDGEIICLGPNGVPEFSRIHRRDAQQTVSGSARVAALFPAVFMPFDVLRHEGMDVRGWVYTRRHDLLSQVIGADLISLASQDGEAMWEFVAQRGMEGLMAKRGDSRYVGGRQRTWVKLKATKRAHVLVGGYTAGKGSHEHVGALEMFLWDPRASSLTPVGRVGSGLTDSDTREVVAMLSAGKAVVIDVEYLELSESGSLRMPVFKGIVRDVAPENCVVGTLR